MLGEDDDLLISLVRVAFAVLHLHLQFYKTRSGKVREIYICSSTLARNPTDELRRWTIGGLERGEYDTSRTTMLQLLRSVEVRPSVEQRTVDALNASTVRSSTDVCCSTEEAATAEQQQNIRVQNF